MFDVTNVNNLLNNKMQKYKHIWTTREQVATSHNLDTLFKVIIQPATSIMA